MAVVLGLVVLPSALGCAAPPPSTRTLPAARPMPPIPVDGDVWRDGARLWYGVIGNGPPVILLHGGLSSHQAWGRQVPALVEAGYQVVLIDSRGHGRSTLGQTPLSYAVLAGDVAAVIDHLGLDRPALVGWSDGAVTALVLAMERGDRLGPVYAFGANMNQDGVRPGAADAPILLQAGPRLVADYSRLAPEPDFPGLARAVRSMQGSLDYEASALARVRASGIRIAAGSADEFITSGHSLWLARSIPGAELEILQGNGHFAPWQNPDAFNRSVLAFLAAAAASPAEPVAAATVVEAGPSDPAASAVRPSWIEAAARCPGSPVRRLTREGLGWACAD